MRKSPFPLMSAQHYLHNTPGQSVITTLRSCADASPSPRAETLAQSFSPQCCTANTQHGSNGTQQRAKGLQGAERSATAPLHTNPHSCKAKGALLPYTLLWGPCPRGAHPLVPARGGHRAHGTFVCFHCNLEIWERKADAARRHLPCYPPQHHWEHRHGSPHTRAGMWGAAAEVDLKGITVRNGHFSKPHRLSRRTQCRWAEHTGGTILALPNPALCNGPPAALPRGTESSGVGMKGSRADTKSNSSAGFTASITRGIHQMSAGCLG